MTPSTSAAARLRSIILGAGIASALTGWRLTWLSAGVDASMGSADSRRHAAVRVAMDHLASLGLPVGTDDNTVTLRDVTLRTSQWDGRDERLHQIDIVRVLAWNPKSPVYVISGQDGQPGHRGWDDDRNGVIDDESELGAAWSDDRCVTALELATGSVDSLDPPHRILSHGAYVECPVADMRSADQVSSANPCERWELWYRDLSVGPR
ncbi:MAG: hypothetical protein AAGJ40_08365 [Planctomycetota bacterium]